MIVASKQIQISSLGIFYQLITILTMLMTNEATEKAISMRSTIFTLITVSIIL
jgi:hypothetical protein